MRPCTKCYGRGQVVVASWSNPSDGGVSYGTCPDCKGMGVERSPLPLSAPMAEALNSIMQDTIAMIATDPEMTIERARAICAHALRTVDRTTSAIPKGPADT